MEEYKDEYTSYERESKTREIIGKILGACFCLALFGYYVYILIASASVDFWVMGFVFDFNRYVTLFPVVLTIS